MKGRYFVFVSNVRRTSKDVIGLENCVIITRYSRCSLCVMFISLWYKVQCVKGISIPEKGHNEY